jgi:hypothetical protein
MKHTRRVARNEQGCMARHTTLLCFPARILDPFFLWLLMLNMISTLLENNNIIKKYADLVDLSWGVFAACFEVHGMALKEMT